MTLRRRIFLLSLLAPFTLAQDAFNCHVTLNDSRQYDLSSLAGEQTVQWTRETPPTSWVDELSFDLCDDLSKKDGVAEDDQCPPGTRACLTETNKKEGDGDRIVSVIPLAQSASAVELKALTSPKGLSLTFEGSPYPATDPIPQSFNLTLLCATEISELKFLSYGAGQLRVEWSAPAGCDFKPSNDGKEDEKGDQEEKNVGSGVGWFFLVLLLAFVAYLVLGAYYNYSTYGATGADLIPHRDFWRDVPYLIRDVVSHLCSSIRPRTRSSRGGYIAV